MRLSRTAPFLLVCTLGLSIFVTKLSNLITVTYDTFEEEKTEQVSRHLDPNMILGKEASHLMWFIQISDLHLSIFHDQERISDFKNFCDSTVGAIKPSVVLASGDLADGKAIDNMGSDQYIQEWEHYRSILDSSKVLEKTEWLDIRGNHDNFNVPGVFSERNYYHKYSIQGKKHLRSYMHTVSKGNENYSFVAVDACLEPGPRRPFNFIGSITDDQYSILEEFEIESRASNATIWFGHYPTSCILSPKPGIRHLMRNGVAYMCGHLHTLGGLVPKMYTLQHSGLLELELGDWKDNRIYRIAAFDHGLFTFADVLHKTWPVVLVTNPKHALYSSQHEPEGLVKQSTHIRILVFSPNPIEEVQVRIDKEEKWVDCQHIEGPLYVVKWDPSQYSTGLHHIDIYAKDLEGYSVAITQPFSLDGTKMNFGFLARLVLMTEAREVFQLAFGILVVVSVVPLAGLRVLHILVKQNRLEKPIFQEVWYSKLIRKLWVISTIDRILIPLIIYPLYIVIGPWFIGEVIEGHIGASFAWGTLVAGKLLPGSFTYFYGVVQAYGGMAFILGPLRTWSVVLGLYLWYYAMRLGRNELSEAHFIWRKPAYASQNGQVSHEL